MGKEFAGLQPPLYALLKAWKEGSDLGAMLEHMQSAADTGLVYLKLKPLSKKAEKQLIFEMAKDLAAQFKVASSPGAPSAAESLRLAAMILFIKAKKKRECIDVPLAFGAGLVLSQLSADDAVALTPLIEASAEGGAGAELVPALRTYLIGEEEE